MRWVVAHANHCLYSLMFALSDLVRAGLDERAAHALTAGDFSSRSRADQEALAFARKMTLAADTVTDEEVTHLIALYGEKQVAAMVLLLAHANFQDRLILALNLPLETAGPLPPVAVKFAKKLEEQPPAPRPPAPETSQESEPSATMGDPDWIRLNASALQEAMTKQRERHPRIRVPAWDEVLPGLPSWYPAKRPSRIRWSLVCLGYQPELAATWSLCLKTFAEESKQDRVFEESLFWVITRTLHCFY
jgi:hypothetical protein